MKSKQQRLQIDMTPSELQELDRLLHRFPSMRSRREVINEALCVFEWAVEQRERGRDICSVAKSGNPATLTQVLMPCLQSIQRLPSCGSASPSGEKVLVDW